VVLAIINIIYATLKMFMMMMIMMMNVVLVRSCSFSTTGYASPLEMTTDGTGIDKTIVKTKQKPRVVLWVRRRIHIVDYGRGAELLQKFRQ